MKILHAYKIYLPDVHGGIPAVIRALCRIAGFDHRILVARRFGLGRNYTIDDTDVEATSSLGNLLSMPIAPAYPVALLRRCADADVLVHHAPFPLTDLAILGLPRRVTLIVYWHADIVGRSLVRMLLSPILRYALRRADKIIVSDTSIADNSEMLAPFRSKIEALPYGIDTGYWSTLDDEQRREAARRREAHPRLIVSVGRLVPYKGYDLLLRALADIDAEAVIIGEGPLRAELESQAAALGIGGRVRFTGSIGTDDIKLWLHAARLYAMPSRSIAEAFGLVQVEAMAAGLPVINTRLPTAVPKLARDGLEGLTVEPEDVGGLTAAMQFLLDNPERAAALGAAGQARAKAEYDTSLFLQRMAGLYNQTVLQHNDRIGKTPLA